MKKTKSDLLVVLYALTKTAFSTKKLRYMPTDATIANYYSDMHARAQVDHGIPTWGDAIV